MQLYSEGPDILLIVPEGHYCRDLGVLAAGVGEVFALFPGGIRFSEGLVLRLSLLPQRG